VTGSDGSFVYTGVAPGEYSVSARSLAEASVESNWVRVLADETSELELVVDPGTTLLVEVVYQVVNLSSHPSLVEVLRADEEPDSSPSAHAAPFFLILNAART